MQTLWLDQSTGLVPKTKESSPTLDAMVDDVDAGVGGSSRHYLTMPGRIVQLTGR